MKYETGDVRWRPADMSDPLAGLEVYFKNSIGEGYFINVYCLGGYRKDKAYHELHNLPRNRTYVWRSAEVIEVTE